MKKALAVLCVGLLTFLLPSLLYAQAFVPTPEASRACQDVNPVGAWRECIEKYQQQEQALKADPKYQEELRLKQQELNLLEQQTEALRQQAEQQRRLLEESIRQQRIMQEQKGQAPSKRAR